MKKTTLFIILLLLLIGLVACNETKTTYLIQVPREAEQIGYRVSFYGIAPIHSHREGKYWTYVGESIEITIIEEEHYSITNIIVKDNGKKVDLIDESDDYERKFSFEISSVREAHTITVEGIEMIDYHVKLFKPKYAEEENDKVGKVFQEYDDRFMIIKHEGQMYYSIDEAIQAINAKNIVLGYGDSFILWIGEKYTNSDGLPYAYKAIDEFNGIFAKKTEDGYHAIATYGLTFINYSCDNDYLPIVEDNLYKLVVVADGNINLYFDTFMFAHKPSYSISSYHCEVYEVEKQNSFSHFTYDVEWSFSIKEKITDGSVDYSNMRVYVNGEDVTEDADEQGIFTFVGRPPASFNEGNHTNYNTFMVTVSDIDFAGGQELVGFKLNPSHEVDPYGVSLSYRHMTTTLQGEQAPTHLWPYYYENGYEYFLKSDKVFAHVTVKGQYDHTDMIISANGEQVHDVNLVEEYSNIPYSYVFEVHFGEEYEKIDIDIEGLNLQWIEYKIANSLASEIDMYLVLGEEEMLVTSERTLWLVNTETFKIILRSKNQGLSDISAYYISGVEQNIISSNVNTLEGSNVANSKEYTIKAYISLDKEGKRVDVCK